MLPTGYCYTEPPRFPDLEEYILLAILILPDTGSGADQEPISPQQGQDDVPHDSEVITMAFVFKSQNAILNVAGKIVDSEQILHDLMRIPQSVALPLNGGLVERNFHVHFVNPPNV